MKKKLYRNPKNSIIAGVLSGFAEYFGGDAALWRIGFIIFLLFTEFVPGVLIYVIAWILIPLPPIIEPVNPADYEVKMQ